MLHTIHHHYISKCSNILSPQWIKEEKNLTKHIKIIPSFSPASKLCVSDPSGLSGISHSSIVKHASGFNIH